jgi:predicted membrane protein
MFAMEKGLSQLPSPVKIFVVSYIVLIAAGLLLSLWVVLKSPVLKGKPEEEYPPEMLQDLRAAQFYANLKLAHTHHLGHVFMVFSIAGIYAFTRVRNNVKIQAIIWTTIATLIHSLGFLIYSRLILIFFGSIYGALLGYMMIVIVIDCYKPFREEIKQS